ncbi:dual specificity protein phosphatase family protein [Chloroflexales bacterium ZM16-3]|nr:dual specificity protein phosphatase family protein [Chloroflexales bacterium ZM16-3]
MRTYLHTQWHRIFGLNASQVAPLLFVGGQFRASQWPDLYALGVRAVLSLQAEHKDRFSGATPPTRTMRLLVNDFHAPTIKQLSEGVAFIAAAHAEELPVFVHCHAGVGRAPLMAAAYLVSVHNMPSRTALAHLRAARPIIAPNRWQIARLREYEDMLGFGRRRGRK